MSVAPDPARPVFGTSPPEAGAALPLQPVVDEAQWQRLVESANPASLLLVINARLGPSMRSRLEPEDILQESLLQAWRDRASARFQSARAFRAWLLTIIDYRIRDAVDHAGTAKRGGGVAPASLNAPHAAEPGGSTTPSRSASRREQAAVMTDALLAVPPEWREVVRLRLFHQMTLQQVGEQLGLTLAVVRRHFRLGAEVYRQRLRSVGIGRSTLEPGAGSAIKCPVPAPVVE